MLHHEKNFKDSILQIINEADKKTIFFVGAGISIPSALPNFSDLSREAITRIGKNLIFQKDYDIICGTLRPEVIFKTMVEELNEESLSFLEIFEGKMPNPNHYFLADKIKKGHCVITTNGDHLIEDACKNKNVTFSVIYDSMDYLRFNENILKKISDPFDIPGGILFKLHGNLESEKQGAARYHSFFVTVNDIGKGFDISKTAVLKHFLTHFNLVFMGYSCLDDFSIFPIMKNTQGVGNVLWLKFGKGSLIESASNSEALFQNMTPDKETKNISTFLLSRKSFTLITGDSSDFIKNEVKPPIKSKMTTYYPDKKEPVLPYFSKFCDSIDIMSKLIFLGRLWEETPLLDSKLNSIKLYKQAEKAAVNNDDPRLGIVNLYLGRVYDKKVGKRAEKEVIEYNLKAFNIFIRCHNPLKAYESKLAIANFKDRAIHDFIGALEILEETNFKKYIKEIEKTDKKELLSFHSRYLNILGLTYMYLGKEFCSPCERLFKESIKIKVKIGDIDGIADSLNAWGLFLHNYHENDIKKLDSAIYKLKDAINIRIALANNRGLYQNYRNLGLCYSDKLKLLNDHEKEDVFKIAENCFKEALNILLNLVDNPHFEDKLSIEFYLAELYTNYGKNINDAISLLLEIQNVCKGEMDWYNLARTKNLLFICYNISKNFDDACIEGKEIIHLFEEVVRNDTKIAVLKKNVRNYNIAIETLDNIVHSKYTTNELKEIAENLKKELRKSLYI